MIKNFIYFIFSIFLFSCYTGDKAPGDVIQPKEMKNILWDVMRAQSLAGEIARRDSSVNLAIETKVLSTKVFDIHKTDSAHFIKSYNWYLKHPVALKIIFDSLYEQKQRDGRLHIKDKIIHAPM